MTEQLSINLAGEEVAVKVRRHPQAKRLILRVDSHTGDIKLTLPFHVGKKTAIEFVERQSDWLHKERGQIVAGGPVEHNTIMPFMGQDHTVIFTGQSPRTVQLDAGVLQVGGPVDMAAKRLEKWLRSEAKQKLMRRAEVHAKALGVTYQRISIGDMKSRWGSCSSSGTLRFSWRLVMAPDAVLDYVAAHEVAHLIEMNHSERFWALVARCMPEYARHRHWLKTAGTDLFKVRF